MLLFVTALFQGNAQEFEVRKNVITEGTNTQQGTYEYIKPMLVLESKGTSTVELAQDWYASTGTTRNTYGTNYAISIRVKGYAGYGGCVSVSTVQVSSGGSWSTVNYYSVYGEDCTYYVSVGGESYYFSI